MNCNLNIEAATARVNQTSSRQVENNSDYKFSNDEVSNTMAVGNSGVDKSNEPVYQVRNNRIY